MGKIRKFLQKLFFAVVAAVLGVSGEVGVF
jgi:hypothetical protein